MKTILSLTLILTSLTVLGGTCDEKALEKRLATYKELTEEANKDLKSKMVKVGCDDASKDNCDHDVMRKIYIEHMESYNKTMNGIIAIENQDYGCPKDLIDSLNKKEAK